MHCDFEIIFFTYLITKLFKINRGFTILEISYSEMDAHSITATVLRLITQLRKKSKILPKLGLLSNGTGMYRSSKEFIDETRVLAHNLTSILCNYFQTNTSL